MTEKDYQLYGTKILNLRTKEIGLLFVFGKTNLLMAMWITQLVSISKENAITLN